MFSFFCLLSAVLALPLARLYRPISVVCLPAVFEALANLPFDAGFVAAPLVLFLFIKFLLLTTQKDNLLEDCLQIFCLFVKFFVRCNLTVLPLKRQRQFATPWQTKYHFECRQNLQQKFLTCFLLSLPIWKSVFLLPFFC